MRNRWLLGLFFVAVLGADATALDDAVIDAKLNDVTALPTAYVKTKFQFEGRFAGIGDVFQPFFTVFDKFEHANFSAWDADNDLSQRDQYLDRFDLLYVARRNSAQIEATFALKKYQRFKATAVVQSVFGGRAFIEIVDIVPLDTHYSDDNHLRVAMGLAPATQKRTWFSCQDAPLQVTAETVVADRPAEQAVEPRVDPLVAARTD